MPDDRVNALAAEMRAAGGEGMEVIERRVMGGQRLRLWMPSAAASAKLRALASSFGWPSNVVPHYAHPGARGSTGVQVVIDMKVGQGQVEGGHREVGAGRRSVGPGGAR